MRLGFALWRTAFVLVATACAGWAFECSQAQAITITQSSIVSGTAGPFLVKDINTGLPAFNPNSTPHGFVTWGGATWFAANDTTNGRELWRSDGTPQNTTLVKDIFPGISGSGPAYMTGMGDAVYFQAGDGSYGWELWRSDGTPAGTRLIKDIYPGPESSSPLYPTVVSRTLYFQANDGAHGFELWASDGTPQGTRLVRDVFTGDACGIPPCGSSPDQLIALGDRLLFTADDGLHGRELWISDGTPAGTVMLADIFPGLCGDRPCSSMPRELTLVGNTVFLNADSPQGRQLWKTDGTPAGTILVRQIGTSTLTLGPAHMVNLNGLLIFNADDGAHGAELWRSDGTYAGTFMLKDIYPGVNSYGDPNSSYPAMMTPGAGAPGVLYFSAGDATHGREVWRTDGTSDGTWRVADIRPGVDSSDPQLMLFSNGMLLLIADGNNGAGHELWVTDGSADGTRFVKDIHPNTCYSRYPPYTPYPCSAFHDPYSGYEPRFAALPDGRAIFRANDGAHGYEAWVSDGTPEGTRLLKDMAVSLSDSVPQHLTDLNGLLIFAASTAEHGQELWRSDGTLTGTFLIKDILPGAVSAAPWELVAANGAVFFAADDGAHGRELWRSDGTLTGTTLLKDIYTGTGSLGDANSSYPSNLTVLNGALFFSANDGAHGAELWTSDGTAEGTRMVKDILPGAMGSGPGSFAVVSGVLFFTAGDEQHGPELWRSDGTPQGTWMVRDINPGAAGSDIAWMTEVDGVLFFRANDGAHGWEVWRSDGTAAGTNMVRDIVPGAGYPDITELSGAGGLLFFVADDGAHGAELWRSDGTAEGTRMVADIHPGRPGALAFVPELAAAGDVVYFRASDGLHGMELWRSDGTPEGTRMVADIAPGQAGSFPQSLAAVGAGGRIMFAASDGVAGSEPWESDGTAAGTRRLGDLAPGADSSQPHRFTLAGWRVFFAATDLQHGEELWAFDLPPLIPAALLPIVSTPGALPADDIPVGDGPRGILVVSDTVWVANTLGNSVSVIRIAERRVTATYPVTAPRCLAFDAARGEVWITSLTTQSVAVLRATDGARLGTVPIGARPGCILFDGAAMWVTRFDQAQVVKIDPTTRAIVGAWSAGVNPYEMAVDTAAQTLWIVNQASRSITVRRLADGAPVRTIALDAIPWDIAFDGQRMWISYYYSGTVGVARASDGQPITTYSGFAGPQGLAFDGSRIWVANYDGQTVSIVRAADGARAPDVAAQRGPQSIAFDGAAVWITNFFSDTVSRRLASLLPAVWVMESSLTLDTYNWQAGLITVTDPSDPVYPYPRLDAGRVTTKAPRIYATVVLENDYVQVTVLPEIGGRVIRWADKTTGRLLTYANPVIKPAMTWGYRGWWLGTGGLEWAFPVEEHGLNEYRPWRYELLAGPDWRGVRVWDVESHTGLTIEITLRLFAGRSDMQITPRIVNGTGQARAFQFWINAMLTLSGGNAPSNGLRFWAPTAQMKVHSTNDPALPGPRGLMSWPVYQGRDFSRYETWTRYAGLFATEWTGAAAAYDESSDQGIVRAYPPHIAQGLKLFCLGDLPSSQYTDDGSRYIEFWGGYNHTFFGEDDAVIQPGQTIAWTETWYPVSGMGGLSWANDRLAAFLRPSGGQVMVGLHASRSSEAHLILRQFGVTRAEWEVMVGPGQPFRATYPASGGGWELQLWEGGALLVTLSGNE